MYKIFISGKIMGIFCEWVKLFPVFFPFISPFNTNELKWQKNRSAIDFVVLEFWLSAFDNSIKSFCQYQFVIAFGILVTIIILP